MCDCLAALGRGFLVIINILFMIVGVAFIIPGALALSNLDFITEKTKPILSEIDVGGLNLADALEGLPLAFVVVGVVVLLIAGFGLVGACCEIRFFLVVYAFVVIAFAVAELIIVGLFLIFEDQMKETLESSMLSKLKSTYKEDALDTNDEKSDAWNYLMIEGKCCAVEKGGVTQENTFKQTSWWSTKPDVQQVIPNACCKSTTISNYAINTDTSCTQNLEAGTYHSEGCYEVIEESVHDYFIACIVGGFLIFILEVLAIFFAFALCRRIAKEHEIV